METTQNIETRSIEITVNSASDLKKAKALSKTKAYAVAFIHGGTGRRCRSEHRTTVDNKNGRNPRWNQAMSFTLRETSLQQDRLLFTVQIWSSTAWGPDLIGYVTVPLKEFVKQPLQNRKLANYQVLTASAKPKGMLSLSIMMGNKITSQIKRHTVTQPRSHAPTAKVDDFYLQPACQAVMQ
ncbi:hypothetical protein KI387_000611, partial [Taxus chinensis]